MVKREQLLALSYYGGAAFTGSDGGLRYRIEKKTAEDKAVFHVSAWHGIFSSENTPEDEKQFYECEFSEEGLESVADWLNKQV